VSGTGQKGQKSKRKHNPENRRGGCQSDILHLSASSNCREFLLYYFLLSVLASIKNVVRGSLVFDLAIPTMI
jgi:hypothetical protein